MEDNSNSQVNSQEQQPPFALQDDHSFEPYSMKSVKLDFPYFAGEDTMQWIFQAEQFFNYYAVPNAQQLKIVAVHFHGLVIPWFLMLHKSGKMISWKSLTTLLECTYGPSVFECPRYAFFRLTQEHLVAEYYELFTPLANRVDGVPSNVLLDCLSVG